MIKGKLDYEQLKQIAVDLPSFEHTKLQTLSDISADERYLSVKYSANGCRALGPIISTRRGENGELNVFAVQQPSHVLVVGSTGSGKTQGFVLNRLMNADGQSSMVVIDIKGELLRCTREHSERVYGPKNVRVLNALDPSKSDVLINPFKPLAQKMLNAQKAPKVEREHLIAQYEAELRTLIEKYFPPNMSSNVDRSWQDIARQLLLGIAIGLYEDLTISDSVSAKTGRARMTPNDITFAKMREIFESLGTNERYGNEFDDDGFFSSRKRSVATKYARTALVNAKTTKQNYIGFAGDYLSRYADAKIEKLSSDNTFDFTSLAQTPQILYILVDFSDVTVREYINKVLTTGINALLKSDYEKANDGHNITVNFIIDEFSTMLPDAVYPNLLATGRGSNVFLTMVVQSISQLKSRYHDESDGMLENCSLQIFVGTNDRQTAEWFSAELGKTTIPDPIAYVNGGFGVITVPVITTDSLLHRLRPGEVFVKVHGAQPIHGYYEYFYKTREYTDIDEATVRDCISNCNDTFDSVNEGDKLDYEDGGVDDDADDLAEFERKCMDEIEKIVIEVAYTGTRQDALELATQRLKRARNQDRKDILSRVVKEFKIATDQEYILLRNQLFDGE